MEGLRVCPCTVPEYSKPWVFLAFEGDSIAADGHDGVAHIVVSLQRGVDVHNFKVHRNAAEPDSWARGTIPSLSCCRHLVQTFV